MRHLLEILGLLMLLAGLAGAALSACQTTVVPTSGGEPINNIGLIADREIAVAFSAMMAIVGAVLLGTGALMSHLTAAVNKLAEGEKEERGAMLRALEKIAGTREAEKVAQAKVITRQTAAQTRRPDADPAFEAAIAADLRGKGR